MSGSRPSLIQPNLVLSVIAVEEPPAEETRQLRARQRMMRECMDCGTWKRVYRQTIERVLQHGKSWDQIRHALERRGRAWHEL